MASDITFKCQNLFPLPISLYQNMVALMFQLFRLKTHGYRFACMSGDEQDPFSDEETQEGKWEVQATAKLSLHCSLTHPCIYPSTFN